MPDKDAVGILELRVVGGKRVGYYFILTIAMISASRVAPLRLTFLIMIGTIFLGGISVLKRHNFITRGVCGVFGDWSN